jgi:hypothetical protein
MVQPVWVTAPGHLATITEGQFYDLVLQAYDPNGKPVYFELYVQQTGGANRTVAGNNITYFNGCMMQGA